MKKALVFFAVLSVMVFVLILSVGATSYEPSFGDVTTLEGIAEPTILDKEARVLMTDLTTYPAYYILNDSTSFSPNFNKINNVVGANKYNRATVLALEIPEGITNLPSCWSAGGFFQGNQFDEAIEYLKLPSTLVTMGDAAIYQIATLKVIDNFENTKVEAIPTRLEGLSSLQFIHLPNTVKTIPARAFFGCKGLEYIILGSSIESIATQAFYQAGMSSGKSSLKVYVSSTLNNITNEYGDGILQSCNPVVELYYTGTMDDVGMAQMLASPGIVKNASKWQTVDASVEGFDKNAIYTTSTIIYNYNTCNAFYNGQHLEDGNPCTVTCAQCGANGMAEDNPVHSISTIITYESFDKVGIKKVACTNQGCKQKEETELPALFTCLGYSASESSNGGIAIGFVVNSKAIDEYKELTGKALKYGVFVVTKERLGNNDVFANDGTAANGVINAEITNYEFTVFELKIVGFTADEQKDIKLALGGYVSVTYEETTEYSYMQSGTPNEGEGYCFVSYNDIVGKPSTEE